MALFIAYLVESLVLITPIFIMLVCGVALKHKKIITPAFIEGGSRLAFNLTLPALLFLSVIRADLETSLDIDLLIFGTLANLGAWLLLMVAKHFLHYPFAVSAVMVQGAYRANTAIIGLALMSSTYGAQGIAASAFYVATITILYNILAVITLTPNGSIRSPGKMIKAVIANPLIIAIAAALVFKVLNIPFPDVFARTGQYFADTTLPLALLCTGASIDFKQLKRVPWPSLLSALARLIIVPLIIVSSAILCGFSGQDLGLIFFMSAAPTAAASFVMAKMMKGDERLAANIIALTSLGFAFTTSAGFALLRSFGWV